MGKEPYCDRHSTLELDAHSSAAPEDQHPVVGSLNLQSLCAGEESVFYPGYPPNEDEEVGIEEKWMMGMVSMDLKDMNWAMEV